MMPVCILLVLAVCYGNVSGNPLSGLVDFEMFSPPLDTTPDEALLKCSQYNRANDMHSALPYAEMLVRFYPSNAMHLYFLGRNYLILNRLAEAMFFYNWALLLDPQHEQHENGQMNIGHISKMLNIDMTTWNQKYAQECLDKSRMYEFTWTNAKLEHDEADYDDDYEDDDDLDHARTWDEDWDTEWHQGVRKPPARKGGQDDYEDLLAEMDNW